MQTSTGIALGTQTVDIWKDSRDLGKTAGEAAVALAKGKKMTDLSGVKPFTGGAKGIKVNGILSTPLAVTKEQSQRDRRQGLDHQGGSLRRRGSGEDASTASPLTAPSRVKQMTAAPLP